LTRWLTRWGDLWDVPTLVVGTTTHFNPRLRRAWGRVQIFRKVISLHSSLERAPARRVQEVLCHEFAHIAAAHLYGRAVRAHGPEWAALVDKAGFRAARLLPPDDSTPAVARSPSSLVEHRCPVCQMTRVARRAVAGWRCAGCVAHGLDGHLIIRRLDSNRAAR
jgi:predicted SprT family Zn-dependent metalloprotease